MGSGRGRRAGGWPSGTDRCGGLTAPHPLALCPELQASELWEVVEEPRGWLGAEGIMPERQEGHLLKKRKWPLKGWHKVGWQGRGRGQMQGPEGMWGRWAAQAVCV